MPGEYCFSVNNVRNRDFMAPKQGLKLGVDKTFRSLLNVLCTFNLRPVFKGE